MVNIKEILDLSDAEKLLLLEKIWDSMDHDQIVLTKEQENELDLRLTKLEKGDAKTYTWQEVKDRLRNKDA